HGSSSREFAARKAAQRGEFAAPAAMAQEMEQVADLRGFRPAGRIPGKFFLEAEAVDDEGFLLAEFANALGADEAHQAVVDADRAALQRIGQAPGLFSIAGENARAQSVARIVGEPQGL